jgi:hypothetical protein
MVTYLEGYKQAFAEESHDKFFRAIEALSVPINAPRVQTRTLRQFPDHLLDLTYENRDEIFNVTKWFIDNLQPQSNFELLNDTAVHRDIEQFMKKLKERELSRHSVNRNTPLHDLMMKDQLLPRSYSMLLSRFNSSHASLLQQALAYQLIRVDMTNMPPPHQKDRKQKANDHFKSADQEHPGSKKSKQDSSMKANCRVCGRFESQKHTTNTCMFKGNHEYANSDLSKTFAQSTMGIKYKAEQDSDYLKWGYPASSPMPGNQKSKSSSNTSISTKTTIPSASSKSNKKTRFDKSSNNKNKGNNLNAINNNSVSEAELLELMAHIDAKLTSQTPVSTSNGPTKTMDVEYSSIIPTRVIPRNNRINSKFLQNVLYDTGATQDNYCSTATAKYMLDNGCEHLKCNVKRVCMCAREAEQASTQFCLPCLGVIHKV